MEVVYTGCGQILESGKELILAEKKKVLGNFINGVPQLLKEFLIGEMQGNVLQTAWETPSELTALKPGHEVWEEHLHLFGGAGICIVLSCELARS